MKYKVVFFWLFIFGALFVFLQLYFRYHFFYIEQSQLFQFTGAYIAEGLAVPGGGVSVLSQFLVQFFILPYVGAATVAVLLTLAGVICYAIMRKIAFDLNAFFLCLLPVLTLLFIHVDFNYLVSGTVAYDCMLLLLLGCVHVDKYQWRLIVSLLSTLFIFGFAGPVALLFAVCISTYELLNKTPKGYWTILACPLALFLGIASVYLSWVGEYRFALLPDAYFHPNLSPKTVIYFSWISLLLLFPVAFLMKKRKIPGRKRMIGEAILQLLLLIALGRWGITEFGDKNAAQLKRLDYYARTEQWDQTIKECKGPLSNFLFMCRLNVALAQKGELANRMFQFDQRGVKGLVVPWNRSENISCLLSDVFFTSGNIARSQEMAFEAYVCAVDGGNSRMLKRLIQTNLIYGAYPVAEKYIRVLERTFGYCDWASAQRKFLYNDEAVEKDPLLGGKRKGLPSGNDLSQVEGLHADLKRFAEANPADKNSVEYLGGLYLLEKNMEGFKEMVETYYGTDVLPVLPTSFQEALIILSEKDPDYWRRFNISTSVQQRFVDYKKLVLANMNNKDGLPRLMRSSFGDTYWFYFMFK